jgi:O-antigen ligase
VIAGGYVGLRYSLKEIFDLLSVFGVYILLISTIFVLLIPDIGIMNYYIIQGAWKGVFWHKNHMGLFATFINILFLMNIITAWEARTKNIRLWILLYLFSLVFLYQSDSVAAYMATILLYALIFLGWVFLRFRERIQRRHYLSLGLLGLIAVTLLFANLDRVFGLFNRNTTLTGRIPMWTFLFNEYIEKRPLTGYGFNAFWYIPAHQVATQLAAGYPDPIIIADNGFIDILVNTGYVGLTLFLVFYMGLWWRSLEYAWKARNLYELLPFVVMAYTLIANISWSLIFENEGFFMLVMMAVLFGMSRGQEVTS